MIEVLTCRRPDRRVQRLECGYPLPCPHHSVVADVAAQTVTVPAGDGEAVTVPASAEGRLGEVAKALESSTPTRTAPTAMRGGENLAHRVRAVLDDLREGVGGVGLPDLRPQAEEEWTRDYAILRDAYADLYVSEKFFDHDRFREQLGEKVVDLFSSTRRRAVLAPRRTRPGQRPGNLKRGDVVVNFTAADEVEVYRVKHVDPPAKAKVKTTAKKKTKETRTKAMVHSSPWSRLSDESTRKAVRKVLKSLSNDSARKAAARKVLKNLRRRPKPGRCSIRMTEGDVKEHFANLKLAYDAGEVEGAYETGMRGLDGQCFRRVKHRGACCYVPEVARRLDAGLGAAAPAAPRDEGTLKPTSPKPKSKSTTKLQRTAPGPSSSTPRKKRGTSRP